MHRKSAPIDFVFFIGVAILLSLVTGCAPTIAPRPGAVVRCHSPKPSDCGFEINEKVACRKRAPAGFYWDMSETTEVD